jgi:hypothetical protein
MLHLPIIAVPEFKAFSVVVHGKGQGCPWVALYLGLTDIPSNNLPSFPSPLVAQVPSMFEVAALLAHDSLPSTSLPHEVYHESVRSKFDVRTILLMPSDRRIAFLSWGIPSS